MKAPKPRFRYWISLALVILVVACTFCWFAPASVRHRGDIVYLSGRAKLECFWGPPNYGEDPANDRKESACILMLDKPLRFAHSDGTELIVSEIQILGDSGTEYHDGEVVRLLVGQLDEAVSGHHRRSITAERKQLLWLRSGLTRD